MKKEQKYFDFNKSPHRKVRRTFQLEKGKYSNVKKENIPIRKRKIFQIDKGKYFN